MTAPREPTIHSDVINGVIELTPAVWVYSQPQLLKPSMYANMPIRYFTALKHNLMSGHVFEVKSKLIKMQMHLLCFDYIKQNKHLFPFQVVKSLTKILAQKVPQSSIIV